MLTHGVESADSVVSDLSSTEESFTFTGPVKGLEQFFKDALMRLKHKIPQQASTTLATESTTPGAQATTPAALESTTPATPTSTPGATTSTPQATSGLPLPTSTPLLTTNPPTTPPPTTPFTCPRDVDVLYTPSGTQFCYDIYTAYDLTSTTFFQDNPTLDCGTGNIFKTRSPNTPICVDTSVTGMLEQSCTVAGGTLYRIQSPNDTCFTMATSATQGSWKGLYGDRVIDRQTVTQFCSLNPALFSSVNCAALNCLPVDPTYGSCGINNVAGVTEFTDGNVCPEDCGDPAFGAICRTLQPGFLVCLAPDQPPPNDGAYPPLHS
ncbi:hypothetical protein WJX75_005495 [Coccomyxa subellipsoidea]|uniref:LysM domain-containing protein n=1 Tax=Coccomyxa subellipsoidea TaxID=248742 RepID=A0ABR2Z4A7_9CHLO